MSAIDFALRPAPLPAATLGTPQTPRPYSPQRSLRSLGGDMRREVSFPHGRTMSPPPVAKRRWGRCPEGAEGVKNSCLTV